jgi:hypothetical protein
MSVGAGSGLARFRQTLGWSNPARPGLISRRCKAAVLFQNRNACLDTLITDIYGRPCHKPLDLIGVPTAERAAQL